MDAYTRLNNKDALGALRSAWRGARRTLTLPPLLLGAAAASAVAMLAGGIFELRIGMDTCCGGARVGGDFEMRYAAGQPQGAIAKVTGGAFELQGGFFSSTGLDGFAPTVLSQELDSARYRYDSVDARFLGYRPGQPITVVFTSTLNPATLAQGVRLELIEAPIGVALATPSVVATSVTYAAGTSVLSVTGASGSLAHNNTYRLVLGTAIANVQGMSLAAPDPRELSVSREYLAFRGLYWGVLHLRPG